MKNNVASLLAKRRSLGESIKQVDFFRNAPGYVRDRMIAGKQYSSPGGSFQISEVIMTEPIGSTPRMSKHVLSMLVDSAATRPAEIDFGGGRFKRQNRPGDLVFGPGTGSKFLQGKGPFHSIVFFIRPDPLRERMATILGRTPPSLAVLSSSSFRDPGIERLLKRLIRHVDLPASTEKHLEQEDLVDDIARRLLFVRDRRILESRSVGKLAPESIRRVVDFMHAELQRDVKREELAQVAGVVPTYFTRLFRETLGMAPKRYLLKLRVERAIELIKSADKDVSLAEIAKDCGFYDQSHLGNEFRRQVGVSPAQFRRDHC